MFCMNCGKELVEGASFCMNCGAKVLQASSKQNLESEKGTTSSENNAIEEPFNKAPRDVCINFKSICRKSRESHMESLADTKTEKIWEIVKTAVASDQKNGVCNKVYIEF